MCTHTQQGKQICLDDNLKMRHQSGTTDGTGRGQEAGGRSPGGEGQV